MHQLTKRTVIAVCAFIFNGVMSTNAVAYGGNYHGHGDYYNHRGYYNPGSVYFGGGWGWGGPNVIINVPSQPYYTPPPIVCERVSVCDNYTGDCWVERYCGE